MSLVYNPFADGSQLASVRSELNRFNNSVVTEVNGMLLELENQNQKITTNTNNISTNTTAIADLDTRVSALEATDQQYEFTKVQDMLITSDTFQRVGSVIIDPINQGIFEYKLSVFYTYNTTGSSAVFRWAIIRNDGTPTWYEIWDEPKDTTNVNNFTLGAPMDEVGGDRVEFVLEARAESSGHELNLKSANIIIDQKR